MSLAAIHLREEPDALRSARPDPCGGQPADGCPYRDRGNISSISLESFDMGGRPR